MTHSGATRRQRFGISTPPRRGREARPRGVSESGRGREDVPGNATFLRYHAAPTARPIVTNAEPFAMARAHRRCQSSSTVGEIKCVFTLVVQKGEELVGRRHG